MLTQDELFLQVRDALHHLYDYRYLERHPLALGLWPEVAGGEPSRAQRFNRLLLESIEELNPPGAPSKDASRARYYSLLVYRYVEEWAVPDIMRELGYSRSEFFRDQRQAIALLASLLREKLLQGNSSSPQSLPSAQPGDVLHAEAERVLHQRETVDANQVIRGALEVVGQLAGQRDVAVECDLTCGLPSVYGSRTLLRQVLIKTLSSMITQPGVRQVRIRMRQTGRTVTAELSTRLSAPDHQAGVVTGHPAPDLTSARQLVEMMGGHWQELDARPEECVCRFDLPVASERVLLAVDDNEAIIRAFRGYLADYHYRVVGAATGAEALRIARELQPAAITLDVMMPSQDGWEILQALKKDPVTQPIPVIICSILEDSEVAHSLGAAAYLPKPVMEIDLLAALRRLLDAS